MSVQATELSTQQTELFASYGLGDIKAIQHAETAASTAPRDFNPNYQKAYPFTTENIGSYIGSLSLKDSDVLAICGSGDFGFSAVMAGAKKVEHVDALKTATLFAELKSVGLQSLTLDEYKQFFGSQGFDKGATTPGRMEYGTYANLRDGLSEQSRGYFDQLITPLGRSPYLEHGFFINKIPTVPQNMAMVPYLDNEDSYAAAQDSRAKSRFHPSTMQDFVAGAESGSFDAVYLSNIGSSSYTPPEEYLELLRDSLRVSVPGGVVIETGFIPPSFSLETIEQKSRERALKIGLTTCPTVVTGVYLPMPEYGTQATIYHKED